MTGTRYKVLKSWPHVSRQSEDIDALAGTAFGLDFEWSIQDNKPTVLGISDGSSIVCAPFGRSVGALQRIAKRQGISWVLHNGLQADLPVLEGQGIRIDPKTVDDTIIWHWLTSPNLCKTTKKANDPEAEKRGAGFLNLYAMCSLYTDAPNWKACRGETCEGPCPEHDVFGYCGNDAYWPMIALPKMKQIAAFRGVDKIYPLHRDLSVVLAQMTERGVLIDAVYLEQLRSTFDADKLALKESLSFNPESPKQVKEKFPFLSDTQEETIRKATEEYDDEELDQLLSYKELGDGPDRWFAKKEWNGKDWSGFVDNNNHVHPRFNCFTSSGRLASAGPNFQNVAKRRLDRNTKENLGKRIRRAVIAPEGQQIIEVDYKNAEGRVMLWLAGYTEIPAGDFHSWMVELCGIKADDPFAMALGGPRDAAKSVTHATNYLEGLQLKTRAELSKPTIMREIAAGARLVFPDWTFMGKIVTFTGSNLAKRAFRSATYENRKRALDIQTAYFKAFPKIRELHKRITAEVERERLVKPPSGLYVPSYGPAEDRLKQAVAIFGQQPVAHLTKVALVRSTKQTDLSPRLQVHDSIFFYADRSLSLTKIKDVIAYLMEQEIDQLPGLKIPTEIKVGQNWADMKELRP